LPEPLGASAKGKTELVATDSMTGDVACDVATASEAGSIRTALAVGVRRE
jgi:hypothetical protein